MIALRRFPILLCMILIVTIGCSSGDQDAAPGAQGQAGATAEVVGFTGKVVETMDAGGYTYVHVESEEESGWAAGPVTAVAVGDEIFIPTEMFMVDFHSKTLDRTFEKLYFVEELAAPHSHADGQGHADAYDRPRRSQGRQGRRLQWHPGARGRHDRGGRLGPAQ